jgi:aspartate aminotransferase-like enzyme
VKLFIPGPTEVHPDVLAAMAEPVIAHRGPESAALQKEIAQAAAFIMGTRHPVLFATCSATGLMEAAIRNSGSERVLSLSCGAFGKRWHTIARDCGVEADLMEVPWGKAIDPARVDEALRTGHYDAVTLVHNESSTGIANPLAAIADVVAKHPGVLFLVDTVSSLGGMPVRVDALGIDMCLAGVQKALALPPGLSLCAVSDRMLARSRAARGKGFYFDLVRIAEKALSGQSLTTPSVPHMVAARVQFARILAEGMERRWERHRRMGAMARAWAKERFALFADEAHASDTLTCIANTRGIDVAGLIADLKTQGILIGNGYGDLKEKAFRIAHMGEITPEMLQDVLDRIDRHLAGARPSRPGSAA